MITRAIAALVLVLPAMIWADNVNTSGTWSKGDDSTAFRRGIGWRFTTFDGMSFSNRASGPTGNLRYLTFASTDGYLMSSDEVSAFVGDQLNEEGFAVNQENFSLGTSSGNNQGTVDFFHRFRKWDYEVARQEVRYPRSSQNPDGYLACSASCHPGAYSIRYGYNGFNAGQAHDLSGSYNLNIFNISHSATYDGTTQVLGSSHSLGMPLMDFEYWKGNFSVSSSAGNRQDDFQDYNGTYAVRVKDVASGSIGFSSRSGNCPYSVSLRLPRNSTASYSGSTMTTDRNMSFSTTLDPRTTVSTTYGVTATGQTKGLSLNGSIENGVSYGAGVSRSEPDLGDSLNAYNASIMYKILSLSTSWDEHGAFSSSISLDLSVGRKPAWYDTYIRGMNDERSRNDE